ncbi:MAG: 5'/3'-nucleotidase SurE [Gammaproteobacteria bacterium]|nr:5'/3'-nucleotidase SurE [Gammaproteobacteria bacterium]
MRILISNDDGYRAEGIEVLARTLATNADITVVAPERNRSGASNSLTLERPLRCHHAGGAVYYVDGTPTDCVHLAITGLLQEEPDIVVSGINAGANLGDDVLYSGTVAAAMEGRFLGLPAIAISLAGQQLRNYDSAAKVAELIVARLQAHPLSMDTILNINVPDLPWEQIEGLEVTRLGHRHKAEPVIKSKDPRGRDIYWVGPAGAEQDAGPGTDFHAIRHNRVSITPIKVDLSDHQSLQELSQWIGGIDGSV